MAKKPEIPDTFKKILQMGEAYGVSDNALFLSTLETYMVQKSAVERIKQAMEQDGVTTSKEYIKGRENIYLHPAIKELPRHTDSMNKTTGALLDIIKALGKPDSSGDELLEFLARR